MNGWSLRRLRTAGITFAVVAVVFVAVALVIELFLGRSESRVATEFMLIASMVIALQVYVGNSGLLSFGHVAFFAIAAYTTGLFSMSPINKESLVPGLPEWLKGLEFGFAGAVGVGILAVLVFAAFTGVPLARMKAAVVPMATLALLVIVHTVLTLWTDVTRGPTGLINIPDLVNTWTVLVTALVISAGALLYGASPWGVKLQAVREDEVAAAALGISIPRMRFAGWMISAGLMALGGSVWALNSLAFSPNRFYFADTFAMLAMLVIGGLGSVSGALLGAAIVTMLSELLRNLEGGFAIGGFELPELPGIVQLANAVLILVVLIWRPGGVFGNKEIGGVLTSRSWLRSKSLGGSR
jgi:branched-chain amino acid transport system permease protein